MCDACGLPASYRNPEGLSRDHVCETCAAIEHGDRVGSAFTAAEMFIAQANMAHGWGLSADDLHRCVDEAVKMVEDDERITCDVPWLSSLNDGPRAGRPWLRRLQPIADPS
jgi:hypothetical protein